MQTECNLTEMDFGRAGGRRVVADFDGGMVSSDAGALLLGEADKAMGLVDRLSRCFGDRRSPLFTVHTLKDRRARKNQRPAREDRLRLGLPERPRVAPGRSKARPSPRLARLTPASPRREVLRQNPRPTGESFPPQHQKSQRVPRHAKPRPNRRGVQIQPKLTHQRTAA